MLTSEKVEIYKEYKGYYDGYFTQNKNKLRVSGEDWIYLGNVIQDIYLIRKELTSQSFKLSGLKKLTQNCDNEETVKLIFELEKYLSSQPHNE